MIEILITAAIRHRVLVLIAGFILALWGIYAVYHTPVDAIPDLSENQVIVFTSWRGHGPREIESQVTYPLSLHLQGLNGVRVVRASSEFSFSMIHVIFQDEVDLQTARKQVGERIARAKSVLPSQVTPQLSPDALATGQIFWYALEGGSLDLGRLRGVQDWLVGPQLSSVPGVAEVASVGGFRMEYHIALNPLKLQALRLTPGDVTMAVERASQTIGGSALQRGTGELIVHAHATGAGEEDAQYAREIRNLECILVPTLSGRAVRLSEIASVSLGPDHRRGVLEKDGREAVGGVVLMRAGDNPLEVTRALQRKILELQPALPSGVRIVPFYERSALIEGAIHTVSSTLIEAIVTATVCILLVLLHVRTSLVVALTLPLAVLTSFAAMWTLRRLGIADIQTNVMSLAGMAISIGVLVDASIVMAENVMHQLRNHFGDEPVRGDIRSIVLPACLTVGRPIFFSVVIMLLSFLPVFALGGIEGKMFHPMAFTKSFAMTAVACLAVTLVPALCTFLIKGRLHQERDSWLVRSVIDVYQPVLQYTLERPAALAWFLSGTLLLGLAPLGMPALFQTALLLVLLLNGWLARSWSSSLASMLSLAMLAFVAQQRMQPLGHEFLTALDEGMVMDMPITVPRISVAQAADDLKARNMMLCRFPEVDMVVGKAGRAETATDPAPIDMIETMVNFRPHDLWPKRKLREAQALQMAESVLAEIPTDAVLAPQDKTSRASLVQEVTRASLSLFDVQMREYAYQRNQEFIRSLKGPLLQTAANTTVELLGANGSLTRPLTSTNVATLCQMVPAEHLGHLGMEPTLADVAVILRHFLSSLKQLGWAQEEGNHLHYQPSMLIKWAISLHTALGGEQPTFESVVLRSVLEQHRKLWREHADRLDRELVARAAGVFARLLLEQYLARLPIRDAKLAEALQEIERVRRQPAAPPSAGGDHHHNHGAPVLLSADPHPVLYELPDRLSERFARELILWRCDKEELAGFGGELDQAMQMPGWTNVWTKPIQNRVDMLATGINTAVGVRVLGRTLEDVASASERIAEEIKRLPGAVDVIADPIRGKAYLDVEIDPEKAAQLGVSMGEANDILEVALGGRVIAHRLHDRARLGVRICYARDWRSDEDTIRNLLIPVYAVGKDSEMRGRIGNVTLEQIANVRLVQGPASIKSDNGMLRNYVRLNVRDRDVEEFVAEARQAVAARVKLPPGVFTEWTGQFEMTQRARSTLMLIIPIVILLIFLLLWWTYHDVADALLILLAVPGALIGGVLFQWLFGYKFSVTVTVGYIACFGMATSTGVIMLVYLRDAIARAGGLNKISLEQLRATVLSGAVQRLRPKLLTEATTVIGLAPMLWATGPGAEIIRPMAAPVLGGILIADEVIDLLLPVLFYHVRRWRWQALQKSIRDDRVTDAPSATIIPAALVGREDIEPHLD